MRSPGILLLVVAGCRTPSAPPEPAPEAVGADAGAVEADFLDRSHPDDLRVVTYNVWFNSPFEADAGGAGERLGRVVRAVGADVWALQEVWAPPEQVAAAFDGWAPLPEGRRWEARHAGGRTTVSRWPVLGHHWQTEPSCGTLVGLTLVDLPDGRYGRDLYVVNAGFTPFEGAEEDAARQAEADQIAGWLRQARAPGGPVELAAGTPIVVLGDLNMVGDRRSLETLLTGDIADEATYGPDAAPDWDGTALTDAEPPRNGVGPGTWTWRSDGSRYPPGRLDFVLYTDSVAEETRSLVLDTVALPPEVREAAGLEALDVVLERTPDGGYGYDHLPVVVDLRPVGPEGGGG